MYKYKIINKLSTSLIEIKDEATHETVGYLQKFYQNPLFRIIDLIGDGKFFNNFKVFNQNKELLFIAKQGNPFKYKNFNIQYFTNAEPRYSFSIVNKQWFNVSEFTRFTIDETEYELTKNIGDWAYITKVETHQQIARWKKPMTSPISNYFELLDSAYEDESLMLLGIFHTYLYSE